MTPIKYTYIAILANEEEFMFEAPSIEKARTIADEEAKQRDTTVIKVRRWG